MFSFWRKMIYFCPSSSQSSSLSLRGILQLLRQDAANSPHRRRRPRFVRRAVRRMRRWGLIPRAPSSRSTQTSSSNQQQSDPTSSGQEPVRSIPSSSSSSAVEAVNQPVPQKLGLLAQSEQRQQHQQSPPPAPAPPPAVPSPPPPPYAPPAPPLTPPVTVPPSSPSLASIFHTLGLSISLFRGSPSSSSTSSSTNSMPLSTSPSFSSSSSDDEVLLIPLSEDTTSEEEDVPMLTWGWPSDLHTSPVPPLISALTTLWHTPSSRPVIFKLRSTGVVHSQKLRPHCASLVPFLNIALHTHNQASDPL